MAARLTEPQRSVLAALVEHRERYHDPWVSIPALAQALGRTGVYGLGRTLGSLRKRGLVVRSYRRERGRTFVAYRAADISAPPDR